VKEKQNPQISHNKHQATGVFTLSTGKVPCAALRTQAQGFFIGT
jgi:hypothetical protein